METQKTPWRKNLDKRYISGEDLQNGIALNKGLRPEMVVTLASFKDAKAFDQKSQTETDKTALYLKEFPSGKMLYKPLLLNVAASEFLSKEIAGGSLNIDDSDFTKPFVLYAKPDRRHGFVARLKQYFPPAQITPDNAIAILSRQTTLSELAKAWTDLSAEEKQLPSVIAKKEELKKSLK